MRNRQRQERDRDREPASDPTRRSSQGAQTSPVPSLLAPFPALCWAPTLFHGLCPEEPRKRRALGPTVPTWSSLCGGHLGPRNIWWLKHQGADNSLLHLGKGCADQMAAVGQGGTSGSQQQPWAPPSAWLSGTPQLEPQSQGVGWAGVKSRGLKQTSVSKHTPELSQLCSWRSGWGQGVCAITRLSPSHPPLPHDQGQSCQKLQGRGGPGSYLDLCCGWPRTIHVGRPAPLTVGYSLGCSSSVLCGTCLCRRSSGPDITSLPLQSNGGRVRTYLVPPEAC